MLLPPSTPRRLLLHRTAPRQPLVISGKGDFCPQPPLLKSVMAQSWLTPFQVFQHDTEFSIWQNRATLILPHSCPGSSPSRALHQVLLLNSYPRALAIFEKCPVGLAQVTALPQSRTSLVCLTAHLLHLAMALPSSGLGSQWLWRTYSKKMYQIRLQQTKNGFLPPVWFKLL